MIQNKNAELLSECIGTKLDGYPLNQSQMGVYLSCVGNPNGTMYNLPVCFELEKDLVDIERLIDAVKTAVGNHIALSCSIDDAGGAPLMVPCSRELSVEIKKVPDADLDSAKRDFIRPFDLKKDMLVRCSVLETESRYCLMIDAHHIVCDGTSISVLAGEISNAYNGGELSPEQVTMPEIGAYSEKLEDTESYRAARDYYKDILSDLETRSQIAPDYKADDSVVDKPCRKFTLSVGDEVTPEKITALTGGGEGPFFIGAYSYAVAKFTGADESIVYTPNHGRHDVRMANTVGMMVRTLPIRMKIDGSSAIQKYVTDAKNALYGAVKDGDYPFTQLASEYDLSADMFIAYQGDLFSGIDICGKKVPAVMLPLGSAMSELSVMVMKNGGKYVATFEYRSDLYKEETIRSFANMYIKVLSEFIKKEKLSEVELITTDQRAFIDEVNSKTERDTDLNKGFVELFKEQAAKTPDKIAVVFKDAKYTYKEIDILTDKIAKFLNKKGISAGSAVPVLVSRCEYMTICAIGVLKSGAAYEPLDPSHPSERLQFMIKDAGAEFVIADENLLGLIPDFSGEILKLSEIAALDNDESVKLAFPKPEDLFVLLYTSGSTGVPKGCMIMHKNITNFLHWVQEIYEITEDSSVAAYASYGFDAHMMDIYPYLSCGATEYIIPEERRLDLMWMNNYIGENNISDVGVITTQVGREFVTTLDEIKPKHLGTGGEKLVSFTPPGGCEIFNLYGPTECTVITTSFLVDKYYDSIPIGMGVNNAHLYVVDKECRMLPVGAVGELCVAGPLVSKGYLNRPEVTEKVYVKNPFCDRENFDRMYHTGDIVRFMPDGNIEYIGRNDGMVKIRGYRIELTEVEEVIRSFEGIKDATVIARKLKTGGQCVNAYIVSDKKIDISELNAYIESKKPPFMVPAATMQIDKIPLNVNGKVDKRALPEIKQTEDSEKAEDTSRPMNILEKKIHDIVAKIIGSDDFGVASNLLGAGMTSLSIIKLAVELNKMFGFEADVKKMIKGCSVLSIESDLIEFVMNKKAAPENTTEVKREHKELYPLTSTQFGVYVDCMRNPGSTLYNIPAMIAFPADTDPGKLADSVRKVVLAHPYVFTHLEMTDGDVHQVYADGGEVNIPITSIADGKIENYKKEFVKPHNLMKAPLFRIEIVSTEKNVYLFVDFHHLIFDGASFNLFLGELKTVCEGGELETEKYTYFDHTDDETAAESSSEYKEAESFFDNMLKECESASEITPDLGGLAENGSLAEAVVPVDMESVQKFCSENGVTPAHLFLAASFYAVSRFTNSRNVYLSTISNGRSDMRLTNCFGMFVRTIPLGISVDDVTSLEFVNAAKDVFTDSIGSEIYPYAKICAKYGYSPNIVYEYQLGVTEDFEINGSKISRELLELKSAKFKVAIHIEERGGKPCVVVQYNDALYSRGLMMTLARSVEASEEHIISEPSGRIRKVSLLGDEEIKTLDRFAVSAEAETDNKVLHEMFERQAAKTPDSVAISACDGKLTYSELDRLSNIVANNLISIGFKKGGRALVLLPRTSRVFSTILGVLKAGGAFIPSSPDYPEDRINSIISDSDAEFVITEGELLDKYDRAVDVFTLLEGSNDSRPSVEVSPDDLAYLIYTSGSTGKPKGVMLRHIGIANYLTNHPANTHVRLISELGHNYGSVTTIAFDMSLKETMLSLVNGLTLVFADDEQTLNPFSLARFLRENNVDVFNATPSRLLQYMEVESFAEVMEGCKVILSGGEKYPDSLLKLLRERTNAKILNTYGPTEITVSSNCKDLTEVEEITIGRPLLNYTEYIVDADDNKLPVGVVGELIIAGCGVALGYNKLPEQTEKAFIEFEGQRAYRSGDYAKWTENGDVVILGRTDNQVKLRGLRIELGEIEKCLTNVEGIKSVAVLIRKVGKSDAICAYYTADKPLEVDYIKSELQKTLTEYMIPTSYNQLEEMPITANGKTNVKALPEPAQAVKTAGEAPKTRTEKLFCEIFANILELDEVYADDNFFDLGGSSLTVTRIIIEANKENLDISYGDVFSHPTPKQLAELLADSDEPKSEFESLGNYDYSEIDEVLRENTLDNFIGGERQKIGDVLLTGAAGFLGIHILHELLKSYDGRVYCLLRDKGGNTAENRLNTMFYYYFEESLRDKYSDRVIIRHGDVTDRASFDTFGDCHIDTVINCAANVKHFSKGTDIEDVNYYGTLNTIDFCKAKGCRLIHVSTMSVGGFFTGEQGAVTHLKETQLYFGQQQGSKYTQSKFLAERAVLDEVTKGFNAKIMRVGTLAARESDGEYQINFTTNTFMGRLKSTLLIGEYPYAAMDTPFELSPIDYVAKAILLLSTTPEKCVVFHPFNNHTLMMGDLYAEMNADGLKSKPAEYQDYERALETAKQDPEKAKVLSSMIAYENMAHGQTTFTVAKSNDYTMQVLYRLGFRWPVTSLDYMKRFLTALYTLGFFD